MIRREKCQEKPNKSLLTVLLALVPWHAKNGSLLGVLVMLVRNL